MVPYNVERTSCRCVVVAALAMLIWAGSICGQTTGFTYQGRLSDGGTPANGPYDFELKLFDSLAGGTQKGGTITTEDIQVTAGAFTVVLDFGNVFDGSARYLETAVRPGNSLGAFTLLSPRQPITSTPYSVRSLGAGTAGALSPSCNGCVTDSQIGTVSGNKVTGPIPASSVPAGSGAYIQNTNAPQGGANFNIAGDGTIGGNLAVGGSFSLNIVNATTQFNLGGQRLLSAPNTNLFLGTTAGQANTTGFFNTFLGNATGVANTTGSSNTFVGVSAGGANTGGSSNSFFGQAAGNENTTGVQNSYFGFNAGNFNTTASNNAFFGYTAGEFNTATGNAFFGAEAGAANTTGAQNSFFGYRASSANTSGANNAIFGTSAGAENISSSGNSFFGSDAGRTSREGGNSFFGYGAGKANTVGPSNSFFGLNAGLNNVSGCCNAFFGTATGISNTTGSSNTLMGIFADVGAGNLTNATAIGANAKVSQSNSVVLGNNANVGIGTSAPNSKLTVAGLIETTSGGIKFPDGTIQTTAGTGGGGGAILNQTTLQTGANFNISGTGTASIFNAQTQYNLFGIRVLAATGESGTANLMAGFGAGASTTGNSNSFFGTLAGKNNTNGSYNSYFGRYAGGGEGTSGSNNTFVGEEAGFANGDGSDNTYIGAYSQSSVGNNLHNATALGAKAQVLQNNSLVLGSINGVNGATSDTSVGIGTTQPKARLDVRNGNVFVGSPGQGIILKSRIARHANYSQ